MRAALLLFTAGCYLCTFWALVVWAGDPSSRFISHTSWGDPTGCLITPLWMPPVGTQPAFSSLHRTPYQSGCAKADQGRNLLSCYCSLVCFGLFLHNLVVIPDSSWEEVSVASIYSSAILPSQFLFQECKHKYVTFSQFYVVMQ